MAVDRTDYIIYGWKLPFDLKDKEGNLINFYDDKYLSMIEGHQGEKFIIVRDQMTSSYILFGLKSEQCDIDDYSCWEFTPIDMDITKNKEEVINKLHSLFNIEEIGDPQLFIYSHIH